MGLSFNEEIVREAIKEDPLLEFRLELLQRIENKTELESLKDIYENIILVDIFRSDTYYRMLQKKKSQLI